MPIGTSARKHTRHTPHPCRALHRSESAARHAHCAPGVHRGSVAACVAAESAPLHKSSGARWHNSTARIRGPGRRNSARQSTGPAATCGREQTAPCAPPDPNGAGSGVHRAARRPIDPTPHADTPDADSGSAAQAEQSADAWPSRAQQIQHTPHLRLGARDAAQAQPSPLACCSRGGIHCPCWRRSPCSSSRRSG